MNGLDKLTKKDLIELVMKLHETVQIQARQIEQQAARIVELEAIVQTQAERISALEEEIFKLKNGKSTPDWVKLNKPPKQQPANPRKKRIQSFGRKSLPPTQVVCHSVDECPKCSRSLSGGWVKWKHQVVDIPPVVVDRIDHLFIERQCGYCGTRCVPDSESVLSEVVVGKKTIGINLMSMIAHLKTVCLVPISKIRTLLETVYGVKISKGEISELLCEVSKIGGGEYEEIRDEIRGSPYVHGDETGWRENGKNGYLWSFSTPEVRFFTYNHSRGGFVVNEVLGDEYMGTVVADFYRAYNAHKGLIQRCWVHFYRALRELTEKHASDASVAFFKNAVMDLYYRAKATIDIEYSNEQREKLRLKFEAEIMTVAELYLSDKSANQHTLAKRIRDYIDELFVFVEYPDIPSENNPAERAIRPAVIARKVSGGTRSERGSKSKSVLMSLFGTWTAQGLNTYDECRNMIIQANLAGLT